MISDYNKEVVSKISNFVEMILMRIEASSQDGTTIRLSKYEVIDSNNLTVNYLMTHGLTGSFTVKFYFQVTPHDGDPVDMSDELEIPKIVNNVFIIEGKMRVPTNQLDNDDELTIYYQNIRINEGLNFKFAEDHMDNDGYYITMELYIDEEPVFAEFTDEVATQYKKHLYLDKNLVDKLKVKLDTDDVGDYIDRGLILQLIKLGPDKAHDNLIDKKIYSPESNLIRYLGNRDVRRKIISGMKSKFFQYGSIYLRDIQNAINTYFKAAPDKGIEIPSQVNPLIFDSLKYKITMSKNVSYNETMTDIIDIVNTPINQNINKINELNVCAEIRDDVIYIKCYRYPNQEPETVRYSHYCTKKVLLNQYWDYDNKTIIKSDGKVRYKLRNKMYVGTGDEDFTYIEPKSDDKLSFTTRRIPLVNMSDFGRLSMGTGMSKQAVELYNSEPSLVTSGHDDTDYQLSTLITKHKGNKCEVTLIKDSKIYLKDISTGSVTFVEIPEPTRGINDTLTSFKPAVKVGDRVTSGSNLVVPYMLRRKSFELGLNANVIYMNYLGYSYEDGVIISNSFADKLTNYAIINVSIELRPDDIISYIVPKGTKVKYKDILVNIQSRLRVSKTVRDVYLGDSGLLQGMGIQFYPNNLITPNNVDEGYVVDVDIHIEEGRDLTSEYTKETIEKYTKANEVDSNFYNKVPKEYQELKADPVEFRDKMSGYISIKLLLVHRAIIGTKLTNRYGSKGIISLILPDECMPRICKTGNKDEGIPAEVILNPAAVISRKNISQLYEAALGKCIKYIYEELCKQLSTPNPELTKLKDMLHKLYGSKFDNMDKGQLRQYINDNGLFGFRMDVGCYAKISYDEVVKWMNELHVSDTDSIYCPDVTIYESKDGLHACVPEKYQKQEGDTNIKTYELGWCEQECITGNEYMMKLYHSADYSAKVTPVDVDSPEPIMGRGRYREQGQKLSEMEMWSLMETGTEDFLRKESETLQIGQYVFLSELLLAGYTIVDNQGNPLLSNYGQKLAALNELGKPKKEGK